MAIATKQKPRATTRHKRRQGTHQKRSNHFVKTYWPYLPLLLIVGVGLFINTAISHTNNVLGYATNTTSNGLLADTNVQREQNRLTDLALNPTLSQAAQAKAEDMISRNYWSHTTPDGKEPWVFIDQTGYQYQAAGENLAYGFTSSTGTITGWMNSPGHRANILNGQYKEVGFGIANSPNYQGEGQQTIVVALYASPATQTTAAAAENAGSGQPLAVGTDNQSGKLSVSAVVPGETKVARVQMATSGGAPWSLYLVTVAAAFMLLIFVIRHSLAWHKVWVRGENFVLKHKMLDIVVVSSVMIGYLLTRTAGVIQ